MRSAARIVDRRWAMTSDVRPRMTSSSARCSRASVSESTLAVASSRTRSGASRYIARANARSWRSPALKFCPLSSTARVEPALAVGEQLEAPMRRSACLGARTVGRRVRHADVREHRARKEEYVLRNDREVAPQRRAVRSRARPVRERGPSRPAARRGEEGGSRPSSFPRRSRPTSAILSPRRARECDVSKHRDAGLVFEVDVLERDGLVGGPAGPQSVGGKRVGRDVLLVE